MGILLHHAGELKDALAVEEKAIELAPDESAYVANHAKSYQALGDSVKAKELYDKALAMDDLKDADHLMGAIHFYRAIGEKERADELMKSLRTVDAQKAALMELFVEVE